MQFRNGKTIRMPSIGPNTKPHKNIFNYHPEAIGTKISQSELEQDENIEKHGLETLKLIQEL